MSQRTRPSRHRRGAAAVELAIALPLLLILLLGIWEVGRMAEVKQTMTNAVREGGRRAALGDSDAQVEQAVLEYLQFAGLPTTNAVVPAPTRVTETSGETSVRVQVSLPFQDARWINLYLVTSPTTTLTAESVWYAQ